MLRYCVILSLLFHPTIARFTENGSTFETDDVADEAFIDVFDPNVKVEKNDIVIALNLPFRYTDENKKNMDAQITQFNHGEYYASAAVVAIAEINNRTDLLPNHRLRYVFKRNETDTKCNRFEAIRILWKQLGKKNIHGFVGFTCACETIAKIAGAMNFPLFSMVSLNNFFYFLAPLSQWAKYSAMLSKIHSYRQLFRRFCPLELQETTVFICIYIPQIQLLCP